MHRIASAPPGSISRSRNAGRIPLLFGLLTMLAGSMYFFQLGRAGLDDAEAYSAYIASRPSVSAVFDASRNLDPGKGGGLYGFALHWYCGIFGTGEAALRALSAGFALVSVILVFTLAEELFDAETALVAAALWAFNPMALIVARWARMYSMFIALTLGSLFAMRKLERRPSALWVATFAILGAAMLYTHLGGVLFLGAEAALLARDRWRGRPIVAGCLGLAIALLLFAPIAPMALGQLHSSAVGHRFDWIGSANHAGVTIKIGGALAAAMAGLSVVFGRALSFDYAGANPLDDSEPVRWCAIWTMLPVLALMAGSVVLHPMFQIRYIAPVIAGFAILAAAILRAAGTKVGNLGTVAVASAFLVLAILFQLYHPPFELWRRIAREVGAVKSPSQEVFFEAGYVIGTRQAARLNPSSMIEVLPDGYLRIPFDYYFAGSNPRRAINPSRPSLAREAIARSARRCGGAWVVSHMNDEDLEAELPSRDTFARDRVIYDASVSVSLYHIVPRDEQR